VAAAREINKIPTAVEPATGQHQGPLVLEVAFFVKDVVAYRESDMYPAWASVPQPGFHRLSRAMVERAGAPPAAALGKLDAAKPRTLLRAPRIFWWW
jgi:hypothetical protein